MNKTILILADEADESVGMVARHLSRMSADFVIFDTKMFPSEIGLSIIMNGDQMDGKIFLKDKIISISDIGVVWNRRICKPVIDPSISNELIYDWTKEECYFALESFLSMIKDCKWMNPIFPEEKMRYNKLIQMKVASQVGLEVPKSIVSNISSTVKDFYDGNGATVLKPLKMGFAHNPDSGEQYILYTSQVPKDLFYKNINKIGICPVFFQEKIEKEVELRIVVVGEKVFACAIDSQSNETTAIDWRKQIFLNDYLPHNKFNLPDEISTRCVDLTRRLGLLSGSIDMILTPDGRYVFLEINQNGQWGWLEILTGLPISKAIANLLIEKSCSSESPR